MTDRQEVIAGFRRIAALLEEHPDLPLPWDGTEGRLGWFAPTGEDGARWLDLMCGELLTDVEPARPGVRGDFVGVHGRIEGVRVSFFARAEDVAAHDGFTYCGRKEVA